MGLQQSYPQWNKVPLALKTQFERIENVLGRDDLSFSGKRVEIQYIMNVLKSVTLEDSLICEIYPYGAPLVVIAGLFGPFSSNVGDHLCYIHLENTKDMNGVSISTRKFIPLLYNEEISPLPEAIERDHDIYSVGEEDGYHPPLNYIPEQILHAFGDIIRILNIAGIAPLQHQTEIENRLTEINFIKIEGSFTNLVYPYDSPVVLVKGLFGPFTFKDKIGTRRRVYDATLTHKMGKNGRLETRISYIPLINIDTSSLTTIPQEENMNSFIDASSVPVNELEDGVGGNTDNGVTGDEPQFRGVHNQDGIFSNSGILAQIPYNLFVSK